MKCRTCRWLNFYGKACHCEYLDIPIHDPDDFYCSAYEGEI